MQAFLTAYIEAALWSSTDDAGRPLDGNYSADNLAPETLEKMRADCDAFVTTHGIPEYDDPHFSSEERAGHDLWLSRNGHGAGFFDRDIPEADLWQTRAASLGTCDLFVGDNGLLYC